MPLHVRAMGPDGQAQLRQIAARNRRFKWIAFNLLKIEGDPRQASHWA
jgi:hypothetical protein